MVRYFFLLLLLQLIGEIIVWLGDIPFPGPVIGMGLLLGGLILKKRLPDELDQCASGLLRHLSLLFIPAGSGVFLYFGLITQEWLPISAAILIATLATIAFIGLLMTLLDKKAQDPQ